MRRRASWAFVAALFVAATASGDQTRARRAAELGRGAVAVDRGDAARTGRTPALPSAPKESMRVSTGAKLAVGAVARAGRLFATAQRDVVSVDIATSKVDKADLGGVAAHAPSIDAAGRVWALLVTGELVVLDPDLRVVTRRALPTKDGKLRAAPAFVDGTLIVAVGATLMQLDVDGRVLSQTTLPEPPAISLVVQLGVVLATSDLGHVFAWDLVSPAVELPRLGGVPTSTLSISRDGPIAIVDGARLVSWKRGAPAWTTLLRGGAGLLEGPVAVSTSGEVSVETTSGQLVTVAPDGRELRRIDLPSPRAGVHAESIGGVGPGPLVDDAGKVAFVRATGEVGVVDKEVLTAADKPSCRDPVGLSAADGVLFVSCSDGTLVGYR